MLKKVIVITGVSSGIGMSFVLSARERVKKGEVIIGLGRHTIPNFSHPSYVFIKTDLANEKSIERTINKIKRLYGRVDVLINNAGSGYKGTIEDLSISDVKDQFNVNLFGLILLTQRVIHIMRVQKSGHIINVSSVASIVSTPTLGYYAATKAGLDKLSEVLEQEVKQLNIKVSTILPGAVKSQFGKNMKQVISNNDSFNQKLYDEWANRFRYYFKSRVTSDFVADMILKVIEKPKRVVFVTRRDWFMCRLKQILPHGMFQYLFLNIFYKYEV